MGYLSDMDNLDGLKGVSKKGVLLDDFASVMQLESITERIDFAIIDLSSLVKNSSKGYDHPAVNNAINKLVKFCEESCESSISLEKIDLGTVRKAIKAGVDSLTIKPEKIGKAKNMIGKEVHAGEVEKPLIILASAQPNNSELKSEILIIV